MPAIASPIIRVQGLEKSFGTLKAVAGINFEVGRGECFGLLGRNGAGKSTTIKMLTALLPPDKGSLEVNGFDVLRQAQKVRQSIGYVAQSLSVDGVLSGRENLDIFGKLYGLNKALRRRRIAEILAMLELEEDADRPASQYSGGMIRRLEIGQSILHQPPLVFLDEPTVGLDPVARASIWRHIQGLQKREGLSVLITTHAMEEAEKLCSRIAIMDLGEITAQGSLAELRRLAKKPRASLDEIFVRFAGHTKSASQGGLHAIQSQRRVAKRLS